MKKTLTKLRDDLLRQLESYQQIPASGNFDRGYKCGILHSLRVLLSLDKSLKNSKTRKELNEENISLPNPKEMNIQNGRTI